MLCGVEVDHPQGLAGHSDADVAVHALMDALLGAAGLGDIGELFPDTDAAYARRLQHGAAAAGWSSAWREQGWAVVNVDVVVVCERPRLAPATGRRCARSWRRALGVEPAAVGVKGTTTEGMGFEGRGEGIAATAVCLLTR